MATLENYHRPLEHNAPHAKLWVVPIGRFLYSLIFIVSGLNHFSSGTIGYAQGQGVPFAGIIVPISGAMIMVGGLSVLFGYKERIGASLIALFLLGVTPIMHAFWSETDPAMAQQQMVSFLKNVALLGGAFLLMFYGAGPLSIDNKHHRHHLK